MTKEAVIRLNLRPCIIAEELAETNEEDPDPYEIPAY